MNEKTVFGIVGAVAVIALGLFIFTYVSSSAEWEKIDRKIKPSSRNPAGKIKAWAEEKTDMPPKNWGPNADSVAAQLENVLATEALLESVTELKDTYDAEAERVRDRLQTVTNSKLDMWFEGLGTEVRQDDFRARLRTEITNLANLYPVLFASDSQLVDETFAEDLTSLGRGGLVPSELQFIQKRFWTIAAFLEAVHVGGGLKVTTLRALGDRDPNREADRKYVTELPFQASIEIPLSDLPKLMVELTNSEVYFRIDQLDVDKAPLRDEHLIRAGDPYPENRGELIDLKALRLDAKLLIFDVGTPAADKAKSDDDLFFELPCLVTIKAAALDSKTEDE